MTYVWSPGEYSFASEHHTVSFRNAAGDKSPGFGSLTFQDGSITEHGENGTTNEQVILALVERLEALNKPPYNCRENSLAITHLQEALHWLQHRTAARVSRGVEGTSTP